VQQRSFYPLFPPAEGCQLSMANVNYLGLEQTPDVLLLPSQLNPFAKRIGDVLCVNPGKLTKGSGPGTFARLTVHPVVRHLRSGGASRKVTAGLSLTPSALVESPDKSEEGHASAAAAAVSPQQLSENFESAAADSTAAEEGSTVPATAASEAAEEGKTKESVPPAAADDKMQVERDAAATAGGEGAAADAAADATSAPAAAEAAEAAEKMPAPAPVSRSSVEDGKTEVAHRVCERTRVDIVRI